MDDQDSTLHQTLRLGSIAFDPRRNELSCANGKVTRIEPMAGRLLLSLASAPRQVHLREELIDAVWGRSHGADQSLTNAVSALRKALRECGDGSVRIETIPKRGYLFVAPRSNDRSTNPETQNDDDSSVVGAPVGQLRAMVAIGALLALLAAVFAFSSPKRPQEQPVVAVLPFLDLDEAEGRSTMADSVAEAVLSSLARSQQLSVIGRSSSFQLGNANVKAQEIARQLGATHFVEGSVRRTERGYRVNAQLVNVRTGVAEWSNTLERSRGELFLLETSVARSIATAMAVNLPQTPDESAMPPAPVFDVYLDARQLLAARDPQSTDSAIELLQWVTSSAPDFADGQAALAHALSVKRSLVAMSAGESAEASTKALAATERALEIDADNVMALTVRGIIYLMEGDYSRSEEEFKLAIALSPSAAEAHNWYGDLLAIQGRIAEHLAMEERAAALNPLLVSNQYNLAQARLLNGDPKGALNAADRAVNLAPGSRIAHEVKLHALYETGDLANLRAWREHIVTAASLGDDEAGSEARIFLRTLAGVFEAELEGDGETATQLIAEFASTNLSARMQHVGLLHVYRDDYEAAATLFAALEKEPFFARHPLYFPTEIALLRSHPKYAEYWQRDGLDTLLSERRVFALQ
ncbi:MAG: winged helix-turn-helix domain-containing protein [Erythrobacter sp.]|uniref:winged helix-turn-helix domain-containing tetratricopeptide repeat protein n=1 Tax=Erythrobacter sp. TaxID=1042 RepID=UPI0026292182|nr:winged helix-turn-helix domain-containing protein [Erythrobacter sp.]MDJ0979178.1 winged helix-turn-helix domain-containing protein [Erythrobacter sp.]